MTQKFDATALLNFSKSVLVAAKLPEDRASFGVFSVLSDYSFKQTASIIEDAAKANPAAGTNDRKIADLYHSYMDTATIESHGLTTLKPHLDAITAIHTQRELAHALGLTLRADVDALNNTNFHTANLFGLWVAPGFNDSDHYAAYLLQGGLQMPDREYYLSDSEHMQADSAGAFPVIIVNGPIAKQIRLNSSFGCLGPDQQPGCVLVQPVHDPGPLDPADTL